ncbi:hypothetical protein KR009_003192, partial [Drosophila setifemur]
SENAEPSAGRPGPGPGAPGLAISPGAIPSAAPRRPKPGILRLDIGKPRRSSGGSVDFHSSSASNMATGANSEVSEHDLRPMWECLRFGQAND